MTSTRRLQPFIILAFLLAFLLLLPVSSAQAQSKTLYWERYDVDITVLPSGDFLVEETQVIAFTSGTFTYGYAAIPTDRLTSISGVEVYEDGKPCQWTGSEENGEYTIQWYLLEPRSNSTHTYLLRYTVHGGLRYYDGGDQLWWKAIPPDHAFPIYAATVTVHLPEGAVAESAAVYETNATVTGEGQQTVVFTAQETIRAGQEMEVRVQFPHGVVAGSPASWQTREDMAPLLSLALGVGGVLFVIGGPLFLLLLWYVRGRDPQVTLPTDYLTEPPSDAPPGIAGSLVDERADMQDVLATIVDLARRGYLQIEEHASGLFGTATDFTFRRTDKPADDLLPFEQTLLANLLGSHQERRLSSLRNRFYQALPKIQSQMYDAMVQRGYFRARPDRVRASYQGIGGALLGLLFFAGFCAIPMLMDLSAYALCPVAGLVTTAVALIVIGQHMPVKTRKGAEEAARWRAFKKYLQEIERYTDLREATDQFEKYLPYAIAFGVDRTWTRKFSQVETAPMPLWYVPLPIRVGAPYSPGVGGRAPGLAAPAAGGVAAPSLDSMSRGLGASLDQMSRGLGRMLDTAASTLTSRPSSSGGGGGFRGGFGGGFSGGGGFGGGGGGGGGRGFG